MGIEGMMNGFSANKKELLGAAAAALVAGTAGGAEAQAVEHPVEHRQYSATEIKELKERDRNGDWLSVEQRIAISEDRVRFDTGRVVSGLSNVVRVPEAGPEAKEQIKRPYGNVYRDVKVGRSYTSGPGASNNVGKIDGK